MLQDHVSKPLAANLGNLKVKELVLLFVVVNGDLNELCMCILFPDNLVTGAACAHLN